MTILSGSFRTARVWVGALLIFGAGNGARVWADSSEDKVVMVSKEDAEVNAAMAKARETLPEFWKVFKTKPHGESDFSLKVKITDKNGVEFFWVVDIESAGGKIKGTINNDAEIVKSVKLGEKIDIPEADIADWLYLRDKKMVGNFTLRAMLKRLPPQQAEALKKMLAE